MKIQFLGECLGTMILVLLGDGVVAGNVLKKTKEENTGWLSITIGWGLAVSVAVYCSGFLSLAHLNPAVTIAMATIGELSWRLVIPYILAQFLGAMIGAFLLWIHYLPYFKETKDEQAILGTFATSPSIYHTPSNFFGEAIGTALLVIGIMAIGPNKVGNGMGPIIVGMVVIAIGLSLGSTTGYAINPARDLGPRIMHALLPISNKGGSDWKYSWIPVFAPIFGGVCGALVYQAIIHTV